MNTKKLLATMAVSAMLLTGCTFGHKDVIIKVDNQEITQAQFDKVFDKATSNSMFAQMGMDVKKDKNGFLYLMLKDKVVNELIVKSLIEEEMQKRNIKVTKEDTDKEVKSIMDKVGSKEKFNELLKQNGMTADQFKDELVDMVKMKKLVSMISKINITDADAKKFYNENLQKFKFPDKVRASHILISANPEEIKNKIATDPANKGLSKQAIEAKVTEQIAAQHAKAEKILALVKKDPSSFAKVAKENSDDKASAEKGGDLGFFAQTEMVPAFSKVAFTQKPNTISGLVQTPYGYHIILVKDRTKAGQEPFAKVKDQVKMYLENQAQMKVMENLIESLKKQAKIEYVNPEYDPAKIQSAIKQQAKKNPAAAQGGTPAAKPAKK